MIPLSASNYENDSRDYLKSIGYKVQKNGSIRYLYTTADQKEVKEEYLPIELETIIEHIDNFIFKLNMNGEIIYANKALKNALGLQMDELIGKDFTSYIEKSKKRDRIEQSFKEQIDHLIPSRSYSFCFKAKNASTICMDLSIKLFFEKNASSPTIMAIGKDKRFTKKYNLFQQLSMVAQSTTNAVAILDKRQRIKWVNEAFSSILGYGLEEVVDKTPDSFLYGALTDISTVKLIERKLSNNESVKTEIVNYHKDGSPRWIETVINPVLNDDGKLQNYICIEQDITERKEKQAVIKQQHTSILNSLEYATRIQNSLIPSKSELQAIHTESFALYRPKDIVSGDFYMVEKIQINQNESVELYIVADCTGHGVPGAMLSVLCSSILKEAIRDKNINEPSKALDFAKRKLTTFLNSSNGQTMYDGMDVSMCAIFPEKGLIQFSGANLPLYLIRDNELQVIKGDRQSIGFSQQTNPFTTHTLPYQKDDLIYMFSDGIVDQFGGEKDKKFMSRRLKELLLSVNEEPLDQQKELIQREILDWKGNNEQTDDICIIGRRL